MSDLIRRLQRLNYSIHSNGYKGSAILEAIDAIQQAHRAAEESAKDAHRLGWEQCRREAQEVAKQTDFPPSPKSYYTLGREDAAKAIAAMEYKGKLND